MKENKKTVKTKNTTTGQFKCDQSIMKKGIYILSK